MIKILVIKIIIIINKITKSKAKKIFLDSNSLIK
jgi:hypothetical protein